MTSSRREPSQPQINKFIHDSVACLQAHLGSSKIGVKSLRIAAKKICDKIPVLRDPKPAAFSAEEEFPYWVKYTKIFFYSPNIFPAFATVNIKWLHYILKDHGQGKFTIKKVLKKKQQPQMRTIHQNNYKTQFE